MESIAASGIAHQPGGNRDRNRPSATAQSAATADWWRQGRYERDV